MSGKTIGIGVVGCGGFGLYALGQFTQQPGVSVVAMVEPNPEAAEAGKRAFGLPDPVSLEELVAQDDIDLVYIATPPFLHYRQAMAALEAGKHVICEKPLAVTVEQGEEMVTTAQDRGLLMTTNLMQRYNPVFDIVQQMVQTKVLGDLLHAYFENYACDENLGASHWFWDREKSGGIFIEHGVHFFDLFEGWMGPGRIEGAQTSMRGNTNIQDQVQCSVRYSDGVLAHFYHGFTQAGRMDRQEMRFLFERGDVTLHEWVPTRVDVRALVGKEQREALEGLLPGAQIEVLAQYEGDDCHGMARHKPFEIDQYVSLVYGADHDKMERYGEILRAMFRDQSAWMEDPSHERRITEINGLNSLRMAVQAAELGRAK